MENAAQKALKKLVEDTVALKLEAIRTYADACVPKPGTAAWTAYCERLALLSR